jgi:isopentenyldiphosphate isomerase
MSPDYQAGAPGVRDLSAEEGAALGALARRWRGGEGATPDELQAALMHWRPRLGRPEDPEEEHFDVVAPDGEPLGLRAPRWLCHLTGLRHRAAHVMLQTPRGLWLLQRRSPRKAHWPNALDATASGHLKAGQGWLEGAKEELREEIGLSTVHLRGGALIPSGGAYERRESLGAPSWLRNRQVNRAWAGVLGEGALEALRLQGEEVGALLLCPAAEVARRVRARRGIAPGLREVWPLVEGLDPGGWSAAARSGKVGDQT